MGKLDQLKKWISVLLIVLLTVLPFQQTIALASSETVKDETQEVESDEDEIEEIEEDDDDELNEEKEELNKENKEEESSNSSNDPSEEEVEVVEEKESDSDGKNDETVTLEAPKRLQISTKSDTTVSLKWEASAEASSYIIYKDGENVGTSTDTSFVVEGLTPDTKSIYTVIAVQEDNYSDSSNELEVKTNEVFKDLPIKDFGYLQNFTSESLKQVIEVAAFDEGYDQAAAQEMIERLELLPKRINQEAARSNVRFVLTGFPVTYLPELAHLRGVVPYGREDAGQTWEDVPGVSSAVNAAKIAHSEPSTENGHSATNLEYHEYGHAIDNQVLGYSISKTEEFRAIQSKEKAKLWPAGSRNESYFNIPTEYFSETFAMYYVGGEAKERLKRLAPETYVFQENLSNRFLSIDENSEQGVTLSWDPIEHADLYEVIRDGEKIGTTTNATFTDLQFEDETVHVYQVKAIDKADEVINENFQREVQTKKNQAIELESPSGLQLVTKSDTMVTIKWNEFDDANSYEVLQDGEVIGTTDKTTFEVTGLLPETTYEYSVIAIVNEMKSPASESLKINTNEAYTDAEIIDFTDRHTFKYEALKDLIEVLAFDDSYDFDEVQKMIDRIALLPARIIEEAVKADVRLVFTDFAITYLPEYYVLRGEVPRGWEETGRTWDDVPGAGGQLTVSRIGYSDYGNGHSTENLEYHEFGHAIDGAILGYTINSLEEFAEIHQEEKPKLWDDSAHNAYYFDYPEEYFAEVLAYYYLGGETKERLKNNAPKTYAFIEGLNNRFFSFDDNTTTGITMSWDAVESAGTYEVYRDGKKIDATNDLHYTDTTFASETTHEYIVKALDSNGKLVNETFARTITSLENKVVEKNEQEPEENEDEEIVSNGDDETIAGKKDDEDSQVNESEGNEMHTPKKDVGTNGLSDYDESRKRLPKTATYIMNVFLVGFALVIAGLLALRLKRKQMHSS